MDDCALHELLKKTVTDLGLAGAQLSILQEGCVREFAFGARDLELRLAVTTDTLFQIGSTTKVFNAALIMTLVDEGRLDVDAPILDVVPNLRLAELTAQRKVTLRHLLSMTSGADNGPYHDFGRGDDALGRYVDSLSGVPHIFAPGTAYGYSNAGINIAGYAAARVTGRSWEQLLSERILRPSSLGETAFFPEDLLFHPVALGYVRTSPEAALQRIGVWDLGRSMAPSGATLCCSAGDLVRFAGVLMSGGKSRDGKRVLSEAATAAMHEPQVDCLTRLMADGWCIGPYWKNWGGQRIYGHGGTSINGSSTLLWCPEKQFAVATVTNVSAQGYPFAERIFDTVFPALAGIAKPRQPSADELPAKKIDFAPFAGRFEAFGATIYFEEENGKLFASLDTFAPLGGKVVLRSELIPLGGNRFLPREPAFTGNRGWDVAFWTEGKKERPTHYLNGTFAFRRTG